MVSVEQTGQIISGQLVAKVADRASILSNLGVGSIQTGATVSSVSTRGSLEVLPDAPRWQGGNSGDEGASKLTASELLPIFSTAARSLGCEVISCQAAALASAVTELSVVRSAKTAWSFEPRLLQLAQVQNQELEICADNFEREPSLALNLDFAIVPASLGLAETGSIWLSPAAVPTRALLFAPQHLVAVLPAELLVETLEQFYCQIQEQHLLTGILVSGPSKTADIEQTLVVGAQGPKSLTILVALA